MEMKKSHNIPLINQTKHSLPFVFCQHDLHDFHQIHWRRTMQTWWDPRMERTVGRFSRTPGKMKQRYTFSMGNKEIQCWNYKSQQLHTSTGLSSLLVILNNRFIRSIGSLLISRHKRHIATYSTSTTFYNNDPLYSMNYMFI